jgi:hypothetical protein
MAAKLLTNCAASTLLTNCAASTLLVDCGQACTFTIAATLDWTDGTDLDLYGREGKIGLGVIPAVYFDNLSQAGVGGTLTLNKDAHPSCNSTPLPPEIITGNYTFDAPVLRKFRFWYNRHSTCVPEGGSYTGTETTEIRVTNTGGYSICVNGEDIAPGDDYVSSTIYYLSSSGTQDGYSGGTLIEITCASCP